MYKYSRFCLMRQLSVLGLESVFLPDEDYGYTSRLPGTSGDNSLAADTVIALAVCAKAGMRTRGIGAYTDAVGRRRNISYPAETVFLSRNNLIHTCKDQDMGRAVDETGYPVSHPIYVDQFTFRSNCIAAHEKIVSGNDLAE